MGSTPTSLSVLPHGEAFPLLRPSPSFHLLPDIRRPVHDHPLHDVVHGRDQQEKVLTADGAVAPLRPGDDHAQQEDCGGHQ